MITLSSNDLAVDLDFMRGVNEWRRVRWTMTSLPCSPAVSASLITT